MALILGIETATSACSVALFRDGKVIAARDGLGINDHASLLAVFIQDLLATAGINLQQLDALAVSKGPGSYTGLRIGVSTAKGICYALDKPLLAIPTLAGMTNGMLHHMVRERSLDAVNLFCPMLDARRMEVYCAVFNHQLEEVAETRALVLAEDSFSEILEKWPVVFFGSGADKAADMLVKHPRASVVRGFQLSATFMGELAETAFQQAAFENTAYFEPFYLKDFIAKAPRVKGLI